MKSSYPQKVYPGTDGTIRFVIQTDHEKIWKSNIAKLPDFVVVQFFKYFNPQLGPLREKFLGKSHLFFLSGRDFAFKSNQFIERLEREEEIKKLLHEEANQSLGTNGDSAHFWRASDIDDASGIFVNKDEVAIVGNRNDGHVFTYSIDVIPEAGAPHKLTDRWNSIDIDKSDDGDESDENGTHCDDDPTRRDLEDIDFLAGDYVVLSECQATLLDRTGALIVYESTSNEFPVSGRKNGGLEGLAVWPHKNGLISDIAVAMEGRGRSPRVYWHTVTHKDLKVPQSLPLKVNVGGCSSFKLDSKELRKITKSNGDFRVPALVFSRDGEGFILLLSQKKQKWLMKCDRKGKIGEIRTLKECGMKQRHVRRNWEGLAWNGDAELVLIADNGNGKQGTTRLFVVNLPSNK